MQASGMIGGLDATAQKGMFKESALSGTYDGNKAGSLGAGSANVTYSTIANVPKAKKQKLISEAKPMVRNVINITVAELVANSFPLISWVELASQEKSGTLFARPISVKKVSWTRLTSTLSLKRTKKRYMTCWESRLPPTSWMFLTWTVTVSSTKMNRFWYSHSSKRRCIYLPKSFATSSNIKCSRT